ncbi:histidine phosphatase family protein [Priestia aryabhattai]|uniref:histidine phosphatase family protein n=1 Tax=Priestia aryabhattai TaxID=412384 RepID=UPI003D288E81
MLYLIRHGQTDWNKNKLIQGHADIPLNETGRQQAKRVAERFRDIHIDVVYTSDLLRAQETAREIASAAKVEKVEICEQLRERSFGELESKNVEVLHELVPNYATNWGEEPLYSIETLEAAQERMVRRLTEIMKESIGKKVAVVSHGAAINTFIHHVTSGEQGTGTTILQNTSITTFAYESGKWRLETINDAKHLE